MGVSDCGKFLVQNGDENPLEMGMEKWSGKRFSIYWR
jgi:hypothetical protein